MKTILNLDTSKIDKNAFNFRFLSLLAIEGIESQVNYVECTLLAEDPEDLRSYTLELCSLEDGCIVSTKHSLKRAQIANIKKFLYVMRLLCLLSDNLDVNPNSILALVVIYGDRLYQADAEFKPELYDDAALQDYMLENDAELMGCKFDLIQAYAHKYVTVSEEVLKQERIEFEVAPKERQRQVYPLVIVGNAFLINKGFMVPTTAYVNDQTGHPYEVHRTGKVTFHKTPLAQNFSVDHDSCDLIAYFNDADGTEYLATPFAVSKK